MSNASHLIREKRIQLGWSQAFLAKKIGVSQQHVDRYEKGYPLPLDKIITISNILELDKRDLLPHEFKTDFDSKLNFQLVESILISIDRLVLQRNLSLTPTALARLIVLLYEKFIQDPANDNLDQNIHDYIDEQLLCND